MGWDELKKRSDETYNKAVIISELQERWNILYNECNKMYMQFGVETEDAKQQMEFKAIQGFKKYFESREFIVSGDNAYLNAKYKDINIQFSISKGHEFGLHFYIEKILQKHRIVFGLEIAKEFDGKYKQLNVDEIKNNSTASFAAIQIEALENNKKSINSLIQDKDKIRYMYEIDRNYSEISGQFDNIEENFDILQPE